ncbi:MAG: hypothetical protein OEN48_09935, partial [Betaproteobacteria bacterium]|nr:hypothetical protein [Betaproteobacteria bacterium]
AFRKVRDVALERFCERVIGELSQAASDGGNTFHRRYLMIYELVQERDDEIARAFNNPRRSSALLQLAQLVSLGLLTDDELRSFTPRTQGVLEALGKHTRTARAAKRT